MTRAGGPVCTVVLIVLLSAVALAGAVTAQGGHEHHQHGAPAEPPAGVPTERADGLKIPDVTLVDQDGKPVRFYTDLVEGHVVAVNFVFTSCTAICPPMGAIFAGVQDLLGERAGQEVRLISVSVDPTVDTPERMKAWGQKFGAGPGWTLVTGDRTEVTRLLKALGVYTPNINDHSPLVLVGDEAKGRWTRAYGLAPPAKLVEIIDETAGRKAGAKGGAR